MLNLFQPHTYRFICVKNTTTIITLSHYSLLLNFDVVKVFDLDCGKFPSIDNGRKVLLESVAKNSTYSIEVSVEYICNDSFIWSLDTPKTISCGVDGLDYEIGRCVKGKFTLC